ncbi:phosphatidylserine decarboxylase [Cryptococcus sp. DSM 104549]
MTSHPQPVDLPASMSNTPAVAPLPDELGKPLEDSLDHIVTNSHAVEGAARDVPAPSEVRADTVHSHGAASKRWISKFFPSEETLDHLFAMEHMGNYVIDRETGKKNFETMPLYVRIGMHLLFVSGSSYMSYASVEKLLHDKSVKQGETYDQTGPAVKEHIEAFIKTYQLPLNELLVQDLDQYPTFNSFFSRRLLPTARPITSPNDPSLITSPADSRLTVFETVTQAKEFWIKGKAFTLANLLLGGGNEKVLSGEEPGQEAQEAAEAAGAGSTGKVDAAVKSIIGDDKAGLAISRLAPQDYHRFHSPVEGVVGEITDIAAVNPQAINEDLNVFTLNKRSVMIIHATFGRGKEDIPVAFVAVGAMLVGSIGWSKKPGDKIAKGEELGWFQYGGSTTICVFPSAAGVQFDEDLRVNSEHQIETLVKVGMEIGKAGARV